jgi:hypothetical protein
MPTQSKRLRAKVAAEIDHEIEAFERGHNIKFADDVRDILRASLLITGVDLNELVKRCFVSAYPELAARYPHIAARAGV